MNDEVCRHVMGKVSRDEANRKSQKRASEIIKWISVHPECKQEGQIHQAFVHGVQKNMDVYQLPRYLLRLNPDNWRFKAEFNLIKDQRQRSGKSLELDPDNEDDKKIIRELLMGVRPENKQRQARYKELKTDFITNSKNGSNGQTTPGIILYDGTYINGNRRDTILDDLAKNPPVGCQPSHFQTIRVVVLPKDITSTDIKANETREQISLDSRERYDYTNSALMVADYIQHLINIERLDERAAIKQIANQTFGLDESDIQKYVDFKKIADDFLETTHKPGQYDYIQNVGKDNEGIVQILKEMKEQKQTILKLRKSPTKTSYLIKSLYAFAWYSREKPKVRDSNGMLQSLNYTARAFRNFKNDAFESDASMDKLLESGTVQKIDWKRPQDHALAFNADVTRAKNITIAKKSILQPIVFLEDAAAKISRVNREMNSANGDKIKLQIQHHGLAHIEKIQSSISEIARKMNKYSGT